MIEIRKLKQLIRLMKDNELTEIDLRDEQEQVTLKRGPSGEVQQVAPPAGPSPALAPAPQPASGGEAAGGEASAGAAGSERENLTPIPSPMVGTFYAAPSPDAEPFVRVGSRVDPETVVCVVEAMKVFNEIKAEVSGTIAECLIGNGQAVEYGQPLFYVRPE